MYIVGHEKMAQPNAYWKSLVHFSPENKFNVTYMRKLYLFPAEKARNKWKHFW